MDSIVSETSTERELRSEATCPDCGRGFTRVEHMKRHRLAHSQTPEFVCTICSKSFYRLDALKRHQIVHSPTAIAKRREGQATLNSNAYNGKVRQACKRCSRMKLKCDGLQPCARCRKAGHSSNCYFRPPPSASEIMTADRRTSRSHSQQESEADVSLMTTESAGELTSTSMTLIEGTSNVPDEDVLMTAPRQHRPSQVWQTDTLPSVHFAIDAAEMDPRLLHTSSSPVMDQQDLLTTMTRGMDGGQVSLSNPDEDGGDQEAVFAFDLESAPSTDLDWLFSGFSPLDQVFDAFPPLNSWLMQSINEDRAETEEVATNAVSRATSPLRILSEAAALTTTANEQAPDDTPESIHQRRQLLPRDVYAPSRRPSITEGIGGSLRQNWPTSYYPASAGQPYLTAIFEPVNDEVALLEDTCQVPEFDDSSRNSILSVAELLPPQDEANVRAVLSSIDNRSYNVMLQLYFEEFHAFFPFLHVATYNPATCSPFLLMAVCAVGCSFSKMRQAASLSDWLIDIAHRTVRAQCDQNMFHARSISTIQALLLCCITFGTSANRRLFEHGEALHSALATMVRRSNLLERRSRPALLNETEEQRWASWIRYETAKRTAWACFVADIELASCWKFSSTYIYDELRADMPCPDHVWAAGSASAWKSSDVLTTTSLAELHAQVRQGSGLDGRSLFERKILALSLCNVGLSLAGAQNPLVVLSVEPAIDEFGDLLELTANNAARHPGPAATTYEALLRYIHLGLSVHFLDLQALGGRRGRLEAASALATIVGRFQKNVNRLGKAAILAGRIVHLVRSTRLLTTCTANILFYAALSLYAIAKYLQDTPRKGSDIQKTKKINLDTSTILQANDYTFEAAAFTLKGVGDLSASGAACRVLSVYADMLSNEVTIQARGISKRLGRLLQHMADAEKEQAKEYSRK